MKMKDVCILITGGTIDKVHDPVHESLAFTKKSVIPDMLNACNVREISARLLFLKDSLEVTDADRIHIMDAIHETAANSIVITHGTSTMDATARYLMPHFKHKTIVLTGAMRPYSFAQSDAAFNLGSAIMAARLNPPGVYIAMNGLLFSADNVQKNVEAGVFEARNT